MGILNWLFGGKDEKPTKPAAPNPNRGYIRGAKFEVRNDNERLFAST
jgi:hypothetical protein